MRRHHTIGRNLLTSSALTLVGLATVGLGGCAHEPTPRAGVVAEFQELADQGLAGYQKISMPEWARVRPPIGTELSPDEMYLRQHAWDLAAPDDEKIPLFRRPVYATDTGMKLGPRHEVFEAYYIKQSYKWHASEEARVNVLLADLHRANARIAAFLVVADRVFDKEEKRIAAVYEAGLDQAGSVAVETLIVHSIINRNSVEYAVAPLADRLEAYGYAGNRARIDLPGDTRLYNVEAQVAIMSLALTHLKARQQELDQQITDLLTAATIAG